eukprot:snap_masked-scaffold_14-processed-gene-9.17-mRNA-1 protein AED:1.00 eAED:1.00 QI:0/-1/0/0/-1/1/1/0/69
MPVDIRSVIFAFFAALFIIVAVILLIVNFDKQFGAAFGMLAVGGVAVVALLLNCLGITNADEKELFGNE